MWRPVTREIEIQVQIHDPIWIEIHRARLKYTPPQKKNQNQNLKNHVVRYTV